MLSGNAANNSDPGQDARIKALSDEITKRAGGWPTLSPGVGEGWGISLAPIASWDYDFVPMPWGLKRYQQARQLHFITFTCYRRAPLLGTARARSTFEHTLERVRRWYGLFVSGYVVIPEHVHLLVSEPERGSLATVVQMLKQMVVRKLPESRLNGRFWQTRYYDFNV